VWPLSRVVKVDDAEVGIAEGRSAGAFTIGVASGNALGLSLEVLGAMSTQGAGIPAENLKAAREALRASGADLVLDSVADLVPMLERAIGG
jgi:phosphonoacetaldehyde hydrolase